MNYYKFVKGIIKNQKYRKNLDDNLLLIITHLHTISENSEIFQQNSSFCHTDRFTKKNLIRKIRSKCSNGQQTAQV